MTDPREAQVREHMSKVQVSLLQGLPHIVQALKATRHLAIRNTATRVAEAIEVIQGAIDKKSITRADQDPDTFEVDAALAAALENALNFLEDKRPQLKPMVMPMLSMLVAFSAQMRLQIQAQVGQTPHDIQARGVLQELMRAMQSTGFAQTASARAVKQASLRAVADWLENSPTEYDRLLAPRTRFVLNELP